MDGRGVGHQHEEQPGGHLVTESQEPVEPGEEPLCPQRHPPAAGRRSVQGRLLGAGSAPRSRAGGRVEAALVPQYRTCQPPFPQRPMCKDTTFLKEAINRKLVCSS